MARVPFADLRPVRKLRDHPEQKRRAGELYFASSGRHVYCPTRLAMRVLRVLDFDRGVVDALAQPFTAHRGSAVHGLRPPEFMLALADGGRVLVDAISATRADSASHAKRTDALGELCERVGWQHWTLGEPNPVRERNIAWLAGYRTPPVWQAVYEEPLLAACRSAATIRDALAAAGGPDALVRPVLFHLMWTHRLDADFNAALCDATRVRTLEAA